MVGGAAMTTAGIGLRAGCPADEIVDLVRRAEAAAGVRAEVMAAAAFKSEEPGLRAAADALALPLVLVERAALEAVQPRCLTRSAPAQAAVGLASVAEACALAAAGPAGRLLAPRIASAAATCALAVGDPI
jgi:cobalt-precorrin 5A hydrolase